jgi:excisionase family DNA binding protein
MRERTRPQTDSPLLLSRREARARLGIGETTLGRLIRDGELRTVRIRGRRLVPARELERYVDRLMMRATGAARTA